MIGTSRTLIRLSVASVVCGAGLLWSGQLPLDSRSSLVSSAEARIGRPLTPMSYAGVARRTTARSIAGPVVVAPRPVVVAPRAVVVAPAVACAQVVNAYGQITRVCR